MATKKQIKYVQELQTEYITVIGNIYENPKLLEDN